MNGWALVYAVSFQSIGFVPESQCLLTASPYSGGPLTSFYFAAYLQPLPPQDMWLPHTPLEAPNWLLGEDFVEEITPPVGSPIDKLAPTESDDLVVSDDDDEPPPGSSHSPDDMRNLSSNAAAGPPTPPEPSSTSSDTSTSSSKSPDAPTASQAKVPQPTPLPTTHAIPSLPKRGYAPVRSSPLAKSAIKAVNVSSSNGVEVIPKAPRPPPVAPSATRSVIHAKTTPSSVLLPVAAASSPNPPIVTPIASASSAISDKGDDPDPDDEALLDSLLKFVDTTNEPPPDITMQPIGIGSIVQSSPITTDSGQATVEVRPLVDAMPPDPVLMTPLKGPVDLDGSASVVPSAVKKRQPPPRPLTSSRAEAGAIDAGIPADAPPVPVISSYSWDSPLTQLHAELQRFKM